MEALQRLKEKCDELGIEYKSELKNGKEMVTIDSNKELNSYERALELTKALGESLVWGGFVKPMPDGNTKVSMWAMNKVDYRSIYIDLDET